MKNTVLLYKEIMSNQWKSVSIYFGINLTRCASVLYR